MERNNNIIHDLVNGEK